VTKADRVPADDRPLFFVHIMKTAGRSVREEIQRNVGDGALYPAPGAQRIPRPRSESLYWDIGALLALSAEDRRSFRAYVGHWPLLAADSLDVDVITLTVLRDPVERTLSLLRMQAESPERQGLAVEDLYEHWFDYPCLIRDHQTKVLSMTAQDRPETFMDVIDVDRDRLARAKANLERIDHLGVYEHLGDVVREVCRRYGWPEHELGHLNRSSTELEVPDGLRERIAEDNALDSELYEHAVQLERARSSRLAPTTDG
jgi:hypothetical protein